MTRFVSVLGESAPYSFGDAVLAGWASDGGMLWPETIPRVSPATLHAWRALSYPALAAAILKLFISADDADFTHAEVDALCAGAFGRFGSAEVVELSKSLPNSVTGDRSVRVAELWHGPTLAFKDLGMSVLGRVLSHLLERALGEAEVADRAVERVAHLVAHEVEQLLHHHLVLLLEPLVVRVELAVLAVEEHDEPDAEGRLRDDGDERRELEDPRLLVGARRQPVRPQPGQVAADHRQLHPHVGGGAGRHGRRDVSDAFRRRRCFHQG